MSDKKSLAKGVLFGVLGGLLSSVILTCICAAVVMTSGVLPADITEYIMLGVLSVGTFFGGFIAARITKSAGLIIGLLTGLVTFLLVTLIGIANFDGTITMITLLRFIFTLLTGGIGGILGVNKKEKINIK